jgi:hypothetical protein
VSDRRGSPSVPRRRIADQCRRYRAAVAAEREDVLADNGVTHVVRVGDTVRRPARAFTDTVQAYLAHLHAVGVNFVPKPLGYDEQGREVLSFVDGDVPVEPLPDWATTIEVLEELARLIRRLHDAAASWQPPGDAVWGGIPGVPSAATTPLFDQPELVAHSDYCPGNVVFRNGLPMALIDFDLARPTTRVADCANALYWWAPLLDPLDRTPVLRNVDVVERVRLFADAYGVDNSQRSELVTVAVRGTWNAHIRMRAAAEVDPVFKRWWDEGVNERMPRAEIWIEAEADRIRDRLLTGR